MTTAQPLSSDFPRPLGVRAPARRFDPFRPVAPAERRRQLDDLLAILRERDGELDFARRRLSRREEGLAALEREPVTWRGDADRSAFEAAFRGERRAGLDPRTLWLIGISKANESESWGVEGEIQRFLARGTDDVDPREIYVLLEEQYHRRILAEACRTCGLELGEPMPPAIIRLLIRVMQHLPGRVRYVPILCGEILGCVVFLELLERCHLFREQPEVEERLRDLVTQILTDETLHVLYCRLRLGRLGVRLSRWMLPLVAAVFTRAIPQLLELGCARADLLARVREGLPVPEGVGWRESAAG